ncbi:hypothetical protein [Lactovum miscens]|uniref:Malate/lactate dehydrogenase n=1 Tax=Lactovum miscens TaxID=190387 RepID=A0A841C633_9LACT|nr:hypothetical protein [Lactovum miscens]MBB5888263.1 malate/lactate dehydrogenase [Lactovum miscens]
MSIVTIVGLGDVAEKTILLLADKEQIVFNIITSKEDISELIEMFYIRKHDINRLQVNNWELINQSFIIFITSAHPDSHNFNIRSEMFNINYPIVKKSLDNILLYVSETYDGRIILVTNPTEKILDEFYSETGRYKNLYGIGTMLDTYRYNLLFNANEVVLGIHGEILYKKKDKEFLSSLEMSIINAHVSKICEFSKKATLGCASVMASIVEKVSNEGYLEEDLLLSTFNDRLLKWESD